MNEKLRNARLGEEDSQEGSGKFLPVCRAQGLKPT